MDPTSAEYAEEREFDEIDAILPSMLAKHLITDIECRVIVSSYNLSDKQAAIYKVIMSKTMEEALKLTEIFKTLTDTFCVDGKSKNQKSVYENVHEDNLPFEKRNPFLNNPILTCLFEFLPLEDIKTCRFVCRQWNSTAEIYLRKISSICFGASGLHPATFIEVSRYSLPNLPFSAYKFSNVGCARQWCVDELDYFFDKWGQHVKEITFLNTVLIAAAKETPLKQYDLTQLIEKAPNLSILKAKCPEGASFEISMDKLISLKTVLLENCTLLINKEHYTRLASSTVSLTNVQLKKFGKRVKNYYYNDLLDFSLIRNLCISETDDEIENWENDLPIFDMEGITFNLNQLRLAYVDVNNFEEAEGNIDFLLMEECGDFTVENHCNVKRMVIDHHSGDIDLSFLPKSIEKLTLNGELNFDCSEPLEMINLQHLALELYENNSSKLTFFENLPNLTRLEILEADKIPTFHLDCIPKSVKTLSIESGGDFKFAENNYILEVDTLILEDRESDSDFSFWEIALKKIRPKKLVISYFYKSLLDASAISKIILANAHIQKIVVGTLAYDADNIRFTKTPLSDCAESDSGCYIFENRVGRAITRKEYEIFDGMVGGRDEPFPGFTKLYRSHNWRKI